MAGGDARQAGEELGPWLRARDPDRFLCALFAPPDRRWALFALYGFNHELARAREVAAEPTLALIRLAWWREVLAGAEPRHVVATPLRAALAAGLLDAGALEALILAREIETEPAIETLARWRAYLLASAGGLAAAAGGLLGADGAARARLALLGAAYGAAGVLRSVPAQARAGRCLLPADLLAAHGLTPEAVVAAPASPRLDPVRAALAAEGRRWLETAGPTPLPRAWRAAALPAVLARRDLARPAAPARPRGLGARLAVLLAALRP